jgi:hypothetical protein
MVKVPRSAVPSHFGSVLAVNPAKPVWCTSTWSTSTSEESSPMGTPLAE